MSSARYWTGGSVLGWMLLSATGWAQAGPPTLASAPSAGTFSSSLTSPGERRGDFDGKFEKVVKRILGPVAAASSCGLRVIDLATGRVLHEEFVNPTKRIYAASSIKTLLSVAVLRRLDRIRAMSPSDQKTPLEQLLYYPTLRQQVAVKIPITQRHTNIECKRFRERRWRCHRDEHGRLRGLYVRGVKREISDLFADMLWISSNNIAGSQLLDVAVDRGGRDELGYIRETAEMITHPEPPKMTLTKKFWTYGWPGGGLGKGDNFATALDYVRLFEEIATGKKRILPEESRAFLVEQLRRQTTVSKLNFHWKNEATFFHKSGHSTTGISDAGYFYLGKNKLVLVAVLAVTLDKKLMQRVGNAAFRLVEKKYGEVARFAFPPGLFGR